LLDNEASKGLRKLITDKEIEFQLDPLQVHRQNVAERAIKIFTAHFIAGLNSTDPQFPMQLWDKLLPQALLTLNPPG
jgi:hypothetical protein